jgi:hypothetical protein
VKVVVENLEKLSADGDSAVLVALAADVEDAAIVGAADVADVGDEQFVGSQPGQQGREDDGPVTLGPVAAAR